MVAKSPSVSRDKKEFPRDQKKFPHDTNFLLLLVALEVYNW